MIGRFVNLQFLLPIGDYFATLRLTEAALDWFAAIAITVAVNLWLPMSRSAQPLDKLTGTGITFLAILVGFSLTAVTILTTNDTPNVQKMKQQLSERRLGGKPISLFQLLHILFTYGLIVQILALFLNIIIAALEIQKLSNRAIATIWYADIFLFAHVILVTLRNVSNLYGVFWHAHS